MPIPSCKARKYIFAVPTAGSSRLLTSSTSQVDEISLTFEHSKILLNKDCVNLKSVKKTQSRRK